MFCSSDLLLYDSVSPNVATWICKTALPSLFSPVLLCLGVRVLKLCVCVLILVAATRSYSRSTGALHTPDAFGAAGEGWVPSFSVLHPSACLQSFIISSYLCQHVFLPICLCLFIIFCSRAPSSGNAWFHTLSSHRLFSFTILLYYLALKHPCLLLIFTSFCILTCI